MRLRVRDTDPGQRIVIEHTETLAADGSWFANIVGIDKEQTDVYIAAGVTTRAIPAGGDRERVEEWEPEFTFHGFRYAGSAGSRLRRPDDIVAVVIASDLEQTGAFSASTPASTGCTRTSCGAGAPRSSRCQPTAPS